MTDEREQQLEWRAEIELERAEAADAEARLQVLEDLYAALEAELDIDETRSS